MSISHPSCIVLQPIQTARVRILSLTHKSTHYGRYQVLSLVDARALEKTSRRPRHVRGGPTHRRSALLQTPQVVHERHVQHETGARNGGDDTQDEHK